MILGEVGPSAIAGDESGISTTFSALAIAPGSTVPASLRVSDDRGATDEASTAVRIHAHSH